MNLSGVLSNQRVKELILDIEELLEREAVDFSFITSDLQYRLLKQLDSVSFKDEVTELNITPDEAFRLIVSGGMASK